MNKKCKMNNENQNMYNLLALIILSLFLVYLLLKNKYVAKAKKYLGEKEVTTGSQEYGFQNIKFENLMRKYGFANNDWCATFVKLVIMEKVSGKKKDILSHLLSPSTQRTYKNLTENAGNHSFIKLSEKPQVGAIVIWQSVSKPAFGHTGIVTKVKGNSFETIEGNVSTPSGYDGVAKRTHNISEKYKRSGLRLHKYFIKIS